MTNYTDPSTNFKLIQAAEAAGLSFRNARIFSMLLNHLGIDNRFHEFILGVATAQNWDRIKGMVDIPLKKIAGKLSADNGPVFEKVYNRLKKNKPEFQRWQEAQSFTFIPMEVKPYNPESKKSYTFYSFPYYSVITTLFSLPDGVRESDVRRAVLEAAIRITGKAEPVKARRKKAHRPETTARKYRRIGNDLVQQTGSIKAAAVYMEEADMLPEEGVTIKELAEALLEIKDLTPI